MGGGRVKTAHMWAVDPQTPRGKARVAKRFCTSRYERQGAGVIGIEALLAEPDRSDKEIRKRRATMAT